jgi:altronate dehydratase
VPGLLFKHVDACCCYELDGYKNQGANPVAHAATDQLLRAAAAPVLAKYQTVTVTQQKKQTRDPLREPGAQQKKVVI